MSANIQQQDLISEIASALTKCKERSGAAHDNSNCGPPIQVAKVIAVIHQLRSVIFPEITKGNVLEPEDVVRQQLLEIKFSLTTLVEQISASSIELEIQKINPVETVEAYLSKLPVIRNSLMTDVQAAYDGDPACKNTDEVILCYPGLLAVTVFRLAHELYKLNVPLIPRMMTEWAHGETGIDIHPGAQIGDQFFIDHGTGVVIGETCEIGEHVKIYQGVTLGALSFPHDESGRLVRNVKRHPTLEDGVVIYANATVLGGKTVVGHDSVIGSSVWLTSSVEPHTTVLMEKPKLRLRNEDPGFESPLDFQI